MEKEPLIIVCGPTATGKSDLAQIIAERFCGCVLSADSMQVYRGMDIGTAKLSLEERRVPHFGLDLTDPDEPYSAALYQGYARALIEKKEGEGTRVVMAGGTGLYIQSVIDDLRFPKGDQEDDPIRTRYMELAQREGAHEVWKALFAMDPESAETIHPNNTKRVVRAIEMHHAGESYAQRAHGMAKAEQVIPAVQIGLAMERALLYERIDARVDSMREAGLVDEVERLASRGFATSSTARQAIGYKEVLAALSGACTMDEAFEDIKRASRRYAKRQMTWFRRDGRICWIDITGKGAPQVAEEACALLASKGREDRRIG